MKKQALVLTEKVEGGEWIATNRLTRAVSKLYPDIKFQYIILGKDIKRSDPNIFLGFLRSAFIDFNSSKKVIEEKIKRFGVIDYVISTNYILLLASLGVKELKAKKKIFYFHGLKSLPLNNFKNINHRNIFVRILEMSSILLSNSVITVSEYSKNYIKRVMWPISLLKKVYVLPNCIPDEIYNIEVIRKQNRNRILYSGRIVYGKGLENFLKGFYEFSKKNIKATLIFCYPKSCVNKHLLNFLKKYVQKNKISDKVFFKYDLNISSLKKIYTKSDLTILPSELEMGPLCVIESLACKTPVIGTRVGNIPEILNKIDSNLIIENNSSSEIVDKLSWFFNLKLDKLEGIRKKGYEVSKNYSEFNSAKRFVEILEFFI